MKRLVSSLTAVALLVASVCYGTQVFQGNVTGSAASLSAASALPASTTATTQLAGTNNTTVATTAFVVANTGTGTVTSVTGTSPVVSSGGVTPAISMAAATNSVPGYLSAVDHTTLSTALQPGGALGTPTSGVVTNLTGVALGLAAGTLTSDGASNTKAGIFALGALTTGANNSGFGVNVLSTLSTGDLNTAVGLSTLSMNNGISNTALGSYAGANSTGSYNLFLGTVAGKYETSNSNRIILDTLDRGSQANQVTQAPIYAVTNAAMASQTVGINGLISLNGSVGTAGYYLTSQGASTLPAWSAAPIAATSSVLGLVKPDGTSILNTAGAISATAASVGAMAMPVTAGSMSCTPVGSANVCSYSAAVSNNGTITLPTVSAGWGGIGLLVIGAGGDYAQFTTDASGNVNLVWSSAGVVANAATASKVQIGAATPVNPIVVTNATGSAANITVSYTYH